MFFIGQEVRVLSEDKASAYRATILTDDGNGTFEVLLRSANEDGKDEICVKAERLSQLLPFEVEDPLPVTYEFADAWKMNGNALYAAKDFQESLRYYKKALIALTDVQPRADVITTFELGENVIMTTTRSIDCFPGMVSDIDADAATADIMLDWNDCDNEEYLGIPFSNLLKLARSQKDMLLQRSIYLNMARCVLKLNQKGWAIKYSSLALAVTHGYVQTGGEIASAELNKLFADCYYFRSKALLVACRPKFATKDCKCLDRYDSSKSLALQKEIQVYKERTAKSNRKLARDIASWVSTAMNTSQQQQQQQQRVCDSGSSEGGDLDVLLEEEGEEVEECGKKNIIENKRCNNISKGPKLTSTTVSFIPLSMWMAVLVLCAAVLLVSVWKR